VVVGLVHPSSILYRRPALAIWRKVVPPVLVILVLWGLLRALTSPEGQAAGGRLLMLIVSLALPLIFLIGIIAFMLGANGSTARGLGTAAGRATAKSASVFAAGAAASRSNRAPRPDGVLKGPADVASIQFRVRDAAGNDVDCEAIGDLSRVTVRTGDNLEVDGRMPRSGLLRVSSIAITGTAVRHRINATLEQRIERVARVALLGVLLTAGVLYVLNR